MEIPFNDNNTYTLSGLTDEDLFVIIYALDLFEDHHTGIIDSKDPFNLSYLTQLIKERSVAKKLLVDLKKGF